MLNQENYPESQKALKVQTERTAISGFIEFCESEPDIQITVGGRPVDTNAINRLIGRYFDIDVDKLNQEAEDMLNKLREMQSAKAKLE